jgi:hypothetical protein
MGNYFGADAVFNAELRLLGEFWEVPRILFFQRVHYGLPEQTMRYTLRGWMLWYDPSNEGRVRLPSVRLFVDHLLAIWRADRGWREKLACFAAMSGYLGSRLGRVPAPAGRLRIREELDAALAGLQHRLRGGSREDRAPAATASAADAPPARSVVQAKPATEK